MLGYVEFCDVGLLFCYVVVGVGEILYWYW